MTEPHKTLRAVYDWIRRDYADPVAAIYFTPANEADALQLRRLVNQSTRIVVGDAGYTAKVTWRHIWHDSS